MAGPGSGHSSISPISSVSVKQVSSCRSGHVETHWGYRRHRRTCILEGNYDMLVQGSGLMPNTASALSRPSPQFDLALPKYMSFQHFRFGGRNMHRAVVVDVSSPRCQRHYSRSMAAVGYVARSRRSSGRCGCLSRAVAGVCGCTLWA